MSFSVKGVRLTRTVRKIPMLELEYNSSAPDTLWSLNYERNIRTDFGWFGLNHPGGHSGSVLCFGSKYLAGGIANGT